MTHSDINSEKHLDEALALRAEIAAEQAAGDAAFDYDAIVSKMTAAGFEEVHIDESNAVVGYVGETVVEFDREDGYSIDWDACTESEAYAIAAT